MVNGRISSSQITASSSYDQFTPNSHQPTQARLYGTESWCSKEFPSQQIFDNEWWEVCTINFKNML